MELLVLILPHLDIKIYLKYLWQNCFHTDGSSIYSTLKWKSSTSIDVKTFSVVVSSHHSLFTGISLATSVYSCWDPGLQNKVINYTSPNIFTGFFQFIIISSGDFMEFFSPAPKASSINLPSLVTENNWGQNNGKYLSSLSILLYNILKSLLDHTRPFLADPSSSGGPLFM